MTAPNLASASSGAGRRGRVVRIIVLVVLAAALAYSVRSQWHTVGDDVRRLPLVDALATMLLCLAAVGASMLAWRAMLADLGSPLRVLPAAHIFSVSQIGKYLPGSVWPVLTQMELGRAFGVPRLRMATAFLLTLLGSVAVSTSLGGLLALSSPGWGRAFALLPLVLVVLHPRVLAPLSRTVSRLLRRDTMVQPPTHRGVGRTIGWLLAQWICVGIGTAVLVHGTGSTVDLPRVFAAVSLSWAVGLMIVVVPAGAGVREGVFTLLLASSLGSAHALAVALLGRLALTLSDAAFAALGVALARRARREGVGGRGAPPDNR